MKEGSSTITKSIAIVSIKICRQTASPFITAYILNKSRVTTSSKKGSQTGKEHTYNDTMHMNKIILNLS